MNTLPPAGAERLLVREGAVAHVRRSSPAAPEPAPTEQGKAAPASQERLARVARYREGNHAEAAFSYSRTAELRGFSSRGGLVDLHA